MTVKELADYLLSLPPEMEVVVERQSEHRRLLVRDLSHTEQIFDADTGFLEHGGTWDPVAGRGLGFLNIKTWS